jgi:hypothetical protein
MDSRHEKAAYEARILHQNSKYAPPQYEATIKFAEVLTVGELKTIHESLIEKIRYLRRTTSGEFECVWWREIERDNKCHYHLLIRSNLCLDLGSEGFARLAAMVEKASLGKASLKHLERIRNTTAIEKYICKNLLSVVYGEKELLLFKPKLGLHVCGSTRGYFVKPKSELNAEWCREYHEAKQADVVSDISNWSADEGPSDAADLPLLVVGIHWKDGFNGGYEIVRNGVEVVHAEIGKDDASNCSP